MPTKKLSLLFILLASLCACSYMKKETANDNSSRVAASPPGPASAPTGPASAPTSSTTAATGTAIAEADGETPGTKIQVQELKRGGNSVMLRFTVINDADKPLDFGYHFGDKDNQIKDFNTVGGITLVDSVGKKKYFVVRDSDNACVCSSNLRDVPAKGRMNLWAKFPPPPDDVQKISIIVPHFSPMDDVAISR